MTLITVTYYVPRSRSTHTMEFDSEWRAQSFVRKITGMGFKVLDVKRPDRESSPKPKEPEPKMRGAEIDVLVIDESDAINFSEVVTVLADTVVDFVSDTFSGDGGSFSGGGASDDF